MFGLNEEQAAEFNRRFESAVNYIRACQIINEYRFLVDRESHLNQWQQDRLTEIRRMESEFVRKIMEETP